MMKKTLSGAGLGIVLLLGACSQATSPTGQTSQCVDIPDVDLFSVENGKFVPASAAIDVPSVEAPSVAVPALVAGLG